MKKILIANRGEIALRIMDTCHQMGIETVAVFSDADSDMPFVKKATYAFNIGEPAVNKSYLRAEVILEIAKNEGVDGIHPGYGFLSENAAFARAVNEAGITFIGPDPETIDLMGDKIVSRKTMMDAGVPVVPGSEEGTSTLEEAIRLAESMGYPVMLKASGGGGGIGMVRCENEQALAKSFGSTKARAKAYFGSEEVFVEKYINNARHVEVQVFGDQYGNIVHLFERDCSIQRRHQKVVEESPSPFLSNSAKQKMYETAIRAAEAVNYKNAGTIEFIVDEQENFYFLEMNTRLQVEHPVTEQITGQDLVKWQILVARGGKLPLAQTEIKQKGHAIEFRLYAEDPRSFLPSPGKMEEFQWKEFQGVRVDSGYASSSTVTPYYDPMIAKCIIYGDTRKETIERADHFFKDLIITGIKTNAPLFKEIIKDSDFINGNYSTSFLTNKTFIVN
ncbi:acetyl-CoA carboxylase biotin carboxylase subunit [Cytobacillus praedii]|uniref:acetyl-CoA carboxylase biotin carboxylase subunit n=1 Tax=Cytobacillus praedii TaxID=1742358 RepID=UPI002E1E3D36|nr:acetyl-CoA carboxylase biotin carboxylase subunit [Cytobacillus praedii]MED3573522.1 acetyl-CoA carboxylase biotin carboxylase subunit [Cytobacillus praedii]